MKDLLEDYLQISFMDENDETGNNNPTSSADDPPTTNDDDDEVIKPAGKFEKNRKKQR